LTHFTHSSQVLFVFLEHTQHLFDPYQYTQFVITIYVNRTQSEAKKNVLIVRKSNKKFHALPTNVCTRNQKRGFALLVIFCRLCGIMNEMALLGCRLGLAVDVKNAFKAQRFGEKPNGNKLAGRDCRLR
jgi:hypothetical protein